MTRELLDERKARLAKLLSMNAPDTIIINECLLVIRAYAGGARWDSLRFVLIDGVRRLGVGIAGWRDIAACKLMHRHTWGLVLDESLDETGYVECVYCGTVEQEHASGAAG